MKKLDRHEEIALFLSAFSIRDMIEIEKREVDRIHEIIKKIPDPTSKELGTLTKVLNQRERELIGNEALLDDIMLRYQGTDSSAPLLYPEWLWEVKPDNSKPKKPDNKTKKEK